MKLYIEKENTLEIDKHTKLTLLNIDDFVANIKKESKNVPAGHVKISLKYKLKYDGFVEYFGESIFDSHTGISNTMDDNSTYKVELVNWKLSDEGEKYLEFNFTRMNTQNDTSHFKLICKSNIYNYIAYRYSYDKYSCEKDNYTKQIQMRLCYYFCTSNKIKSFSVNLDSKDEEIGVRSTIFQNFNNSNFKERFKDVDSFIETYREYPIHWRITMEYCGCLFDISSICLGTIGIVIRDDLNVDFKPLFQEIESKIYNEDSSK